MSALQLKDKLLTIRNEEWKLSDEVNKYEMVLEMFRNIGSTDPIFRDELILKLMCRLIDDGKLKNEELKNIMSLALSKEHLFYNFPSYNDDSVFNRTFSVLVIAEILNFHNNNEKIFNSLEIENIYNCIIRYFKEERDVRGYVETKGWAHSVAHTADALKEIVSCEGIDRLKLIEILECIKRKVLVDYYSYVGMEEERLVSVVISVLEKDMLDVADVTNWIKDFEKRESFVFPQNFHIDINRKNFLSALYFRLKRKGKYKEIIEVVEKVINNTTREAFK